MERGWEPLPWPAGRLKSSGEEMTWAPVALWFPAATKQQKLPVNAALSQPLSTLDL